MAVATFHVCVDGDSVLEVEARPGTLHSTAPPPPDWTPPRHPFLHGVATDPAHEDELGGILGASEGVVDFLERVIAAGYDVVDGAVSRWDLEGPERRITTREGKVVGVAFPVAGPLATLATEVPETRESFAHALVCVYDEAALGAVRAALAASDTFEGFEARLGERGLGFLPR